MCKWKRDIFCTDNLFDAYLLVFFQLAHFFHISLFLFFCASKYTYHFMEIYHLTGKTVCVEYFAYLEKKFVKISINSTYCWLSSEEKSSILLIESSVLGRKKTNPIQFILKLHVPLESNKKPIVAR